MQNIWQTPTDKTLTTFEKPLIISFGQNSDIPILIEIKKVNKILILQL
jgi:hypothetical protein